MLASHGSGVVAEAMPPALRIFTEFSKHLCGPMPALFFPDLETKAYCQADYALDSSSNVYFETCASEDTVTFFVLFWVFHHSYKVCH